MEADTNYDVIIVGSGAAGLAAAVYAGRYLMKTLVAVGEFGGESATAGIIWNYPGAKGVDGYELMSTMRDQAKETGAVFVDGKVELVKQSENDNCFEVKIGDQNYSTKSVIFAQGTERRRLNLPNEDNLKGKGVHYCVTCDGPLYSGKTVAIVGGGDASIKGTNLMGQYATKIYLITLDKELHGEPINMEEMERLGDKVQVITNTKIEGLVGEDKLQKLILSEEFNGSKELIVEALFEEIGSIPNVDLPKSLGVNIGHDGYLIVDSSMKTNIEGVFAAGDTTSFFGDFKQIITASAMGAMAATSAYRYTKNNKNICHLHWKVAD